MKIQCDAVALALAATLATTGSALASPQNSTNGHATDRGNFERSLQPAPHPHAHQVAANEEEAGSTSSHSRDSANFYAVLPQLSGPR